MTDLRGPFSVQHEHWKTYCGAAAFGTFGELLQGALPDGRDFLVTLPIARWSIASFRRDPDRDAVYVLPDHKTKSRLLVENMLRAYGVSGGGMLLLDSELPEGKGMASSSADLVATTRAVGRAVGLEPGPEEIEALLCAIEPTDGVMHDGVVAFHHREVRLRAHLGYPPPMTVVGIDEGGSVDTMSFNRLPKAFTEDQRRTYHRLLTVLTTAMGTWDVAAIGQVATHSALMNQRLCPKRTLSDLIQVCRQVGGLGVVAAHSGTTLGVLLADRALAHGDRLERTVQACAELSDTVWIEKVLAGRARSPVERFPVCCRTLAGDGSPLAARRQRST